ncbi:hypothetical protein GCM10022226_44190 [Sphaerisporangium flaviroseum]|uniref:Uncharacterized protein n=1 Tax=Sphaerisporangium flaviroseum TaxID=509199 RepID=A0ABP7II32_9ACTN
MEYRHPLGQAGVLVQQGTRQVERLAGDVAAALDHQGALAEVVPGAWPDYVPGYQLRLSGRKPEARQRLCRSLATVRDGTGTSAVDPPDLEARVVTQLAITAVVTASYPEMAGSRPSRSAGPFAHLTRCRKAESADRLPAASRKWHGWRMADRIESPVQR